MILIDRDVTDPDLFRAANDPKKRQPFAVAVRSQINPQNGSVSFINADGTVVGQEPMQYGVRHDAQDEGSIGVYQMFTVKGAVVTIQTRAQDPMFVYTIAEGQAY